MSRPKVCRATLLKQLSPLTMLAVVASVTWGTSAHATRLINGQEVPAGSYQYVVNISTNGAPCTASLVGPKTIVTAAHCVPNGGTASFKVGGKSYTAKMTRSPIYNYPTVDHDVALGVVNEEVSGIDFVSVGGKASTGLGIQLLGYGCTQKPKPGEPPVSDGKLRIGSTVITGFANFEMVSRQAGGAAICFGDSGGPALVKVDNKDFILGVTTKGNLVDMNWSLRLDGPESQTFLKDFASQNNVKICGVNADCGGSPVTPPPKCSLSASPSVVKKGETIVFSISTTGQVTSASIDGTAVTFPTGTKSMVANSVGNFTASGSVTGPGGTGSYSASYSVEDGPVIQLPKCTLSATPDSVNVGESITLELNSQFATGASIDGVSVTVPTGKRVIQATQKGTFSALGKVTNANGTGACQASYVVGDTPTDTPNFSAVPVYCGENVVTDTKVSTVCLGVVKKDSSITSMPLSQVVIVTYSDTSREVMPIMARRPRAKINDVQVKEDLFLYANGAMGGKYLVLDSRDAVLTKMVSGEKSRSETPIAIEGRTQKGKYFLVEKLSPVALENRN